MNKLILFLLLIYFQVAFTQEPNLDYNPTRLIIKFTESSELYSQLRKIQLSGPADKIELSELLDNPSIHSFFVEHKILSIQPASISTSGSNVSNDISRIYFFDFLNNSDLELAYKSLIQSANFDYVEYDWKGYGGGKQVSPSSFQKEMIIPNDPYFSNQWSLRNTGQTIGGVAGTAGADINITPAWDLTVGNENTIVSVLDSGIPLAAAEFSGRLLPGYDFANNDNDPTDDNGHGTNVASIIGASGNNSIGIAGINWNCKIIPIKIINSGNWGYYSWWISGITMAVDSGAQVLSMSVGGSDFSQGMLDAVNYALNSGSIVVACMMNENNEVTFYPAGFDNVISVGALNNLDQRAVPFCWGGGSNYGNHIDFVAPGNWVIGLSHTNPTSTTYWCGTSQATPMVTGLISLMLGLNPSLSLAQIYEMIKLYTHDQIGNPSEDIPGWDKYYGWGRIDVYAVINYILTDVSENEIEPLTFSLSQNYPNPFNPTTTIKYDIPNTSDVSLVVYDLLGRKVKELVNAKQQAGRYEIQFNASNLASGVYIYQLIAEKFISSKKLILLK